MTDRDPAGMDLPSLPDPLDDAILERALDPLFGDWDRRPGLRDAAVMLPWFTRDGVDYLLFTRRPEHLPTHAGQLAFPGGVREGSETPLQTATREAFEEVRLEPSAGRALGAMTPRLSSSGFRVHAVVARIDGTELLEPCPREVDVLIEFSVRDLADPANWREEQLPAVRRPTPCFRQQGQLLWGLTARLTLDLIERLRGVTGTGRD